MEQSPIRKVGRFGIRRRILIFSACATLLPSMLLGWVSYFETHQLMVEKTEHQLSRLLNHAALTIGDILKRRQQDIAVFAASPVVKENLERHRLQTNGSNSGDNNNADSDAPARQLGDYLELLRSEAGDYRRLQVRDQNGVTVAQAPNSGSVSDTSDALPVQLEHSGVNSVTDELAVVDGDRILMATPVKTDRGVRLGFMTAEVPLQALAGALELVPPMDGLDLFLVDEQGAVLLQPVVKEGVAAFPIRVKPRVVDLFSSPRQLRIYENPEGLRVVGLLVPVDGLPWALVIETAYDTAFTEVNQLRDTSLVIILLLLLGFGLLSFLVSQGILVPLGQLTQASKRVAGGDLDVQLRPSKRDELGFTMEVFNDMVSQLKISRQQLEKMAVTDSLTGLLNRKQIMKILDLQLQRHRRNGPTFSVLMADLDHFKNINDRFGHLGGDEVLRQVGRVFRSLLRSIDSAARYGGEEFLIILEQTTHKEALMTAERIRSETESTVLVFEGQRIPITVSIGVATIDGEDIDSIEKVLRTADRQLYRAKACGRNCVMPGSHLALMRDTREEVDN